MPDTELIFTDSSNTPRNAVVFTPMAGTIKGTVAVFLGGNKREGTNFIEISTKGWNETGSITVTINVDECEFLQEMKTLGWRLVVLADTQTVKPDGIVVNEYWIEEYLDKINATWAGNHFAVGHSAGAYVTGLHIRHFREGRANSHFANGIFSFAVQVNNPAKKTDFQTTDFAQRPTLFLSGSSVLDNDPKQLAYDRTRSIFVVPACGSGTRQGWEAIDVDHNIFAKICGTNRAVTNIVDDWFSKFPNLPRPPLSSCPSSESVTNPDGCN